MAKIRPLKVGPPAINWKSSLYENFHPAATENLRETNVELREEIPKTSTKRLL